MLKSTIKYLILIMLIPLTSHNAYAKTYFNLKEFDEADIKLKSNKEYISKKIQTVLPKCNDRNFWDSISNNYQKEIIEISKEYENYHPSYILPSTYKDAFNSENKASILKIQRGRRKAMINLLFAECMEYKGRYIEKIADLSWIINEETYWGSPSALLNREEDTYELPTPDNEIVELWIAETAKDLAIVYYFLGKELDEYSPNIRKRISTELETRFFSNIQALLSRYEFRYKNKKVVNNWFAWIGKNWLLTTVLLNKSDEFTNRNLIGSLKLLNMFYSAIPEDGSVSEGGLYWQAGVGRLYDSIRLASMLLTNLSELKDEKLIKMCEFIANLHIGKGYYSNFSDSMAKLNIQPLRILDMAEITGSHIIKKYYIESFNETEIPMNPGEFDVFDKRLYEIFLHRNYEKEPLEKYENNEDLVWLKTLGYIKSESTKEDSELTLTVKIGNNSSSHNHNDVGVFEIYYNQHPYIVDPGRQTYDLNMFGENRYTEKYWFNTSSNHNIAMIEKIEQSYGPSFKGKIKNVEFDKNINLTKIEADIKDAFPKSSYLEKYDRKLEHFKNKQIILSDIIKTKHPKNVEISFITPIKEDDITIIKDGTIMLKNKDGNMLLSYEKNKYNLKIKKMTVDKLMLHSWPNGLNKITFKTKKSKKYNNLKFSFKVQPKVKDIKIN